jgi:hypothetical protein
MSNATVAAPGRTGATHAELALKHIRLGLALFIAGFLTGYVPILHYMHGGSIEGSVGPDFLRNITLWWGCPAVLPELVLKTGGLGMVAIGLCYAVLAPRGGAPISSGERLAPALCAFGLVAELLTAGVGYVLCNHFWPNFYYAAVPAGKNVWLAAQGISITFYVVGIFCSFAGVRRVSHGWAHDAWARSS